MSFPSSSSHSSSRNQQQQQRAMPFQLFLEKMRQPLAAELVSGIKHFINTFVLEEDKEDCLLYTSPSPRDVEESRMPSSA